MSKPLHLALFYHKSNRYSFNALLGALETSPTLFEQLNIQFYENDQNLFNGLKEHSDSGEKCVLCFSFYTPQVCAIQKRIFALRKLYGSELIILGGGPHATGAPHHALKLGFDAIVVGEGESLFPSLLESLIRGQRVEGVFGPTQPLVLDHYPIFSMRFKTIGPLEITRGCVFGCSFCQIQSLFGKKLRHRSVDNILDHVRIMTNHKMFNFRFITPNAFSYGSHNGRTLNLHSIETLLTGIRQIAGSKANIFFGSFPSEVRPDHITSDSLKIIRQYTKNKMLVIGGQSGSDRILKLCHRGHTVQDIINAVDRIVLNGIIPVVDFIFDLPQETEADIEQTIQVMRCITKMGAKIHAHSFMPLPGTRFSNEPVHGIKRNLKDILLKEFLPNGMLFGNWKEQEQYALAMKSLNDAALKHQQSTARPK